MVHAEHQRGIHCARRRWWLLRHALAQTPPYFRSRQMRVTSENAGSGKGKGPRGPREGEGLRYRLRIQKTDLPCRVVRPPRGGATGDEVRG